MIMKNSQWPLPKVHNSLKLYKRDKTISEKSSLTDSTLKRLSTFELEIFDLKKPIPLLNHLFKKDKKK